VSFYEFSDYDRLVEAAHALDPRVEAMVVLGGDAGLRRGEIMALEWTDLDSKRRQIHVQRSEWSGKVTAPKGWRSRIVPMTDAAERVLHAVRHLRGRLVLLRNEGTPITNKVVRIVDALRPAPLHVLLAAFGVHTSDAGHALAVVAASEEADRHARFVQGGNCPGPSRSVNRTPPRTGQSDSETPVGEC
jgi:integrase